MKRFLSAFYILLCFCVCPDILAQDYDNLEPLTLLNRSVLDKSCRAIQRNDISIQPDVAKLLSDAEGANIAIIPLRSDAKVDVICGQTEPELQGWIPQPTKDGYKYTPVATPDFCYNEAGQSVSAYILYPMKTGEKNPVKSVRTKGNSVEVRFADGGKDRIAYSVEGKKLKTLEFKSKDKKFSILK